MKASYEKKLKNKILKEKLLGILYPRVCPVCGKLLKPDLTELLNYQPGSSFFCENPFICPECAGELKYCADKARCMKCSRPLQDEGAELCRECQTVERNFDFGTAALVHDKAAGDIVYALKYSSLKCNAEFGAFEMLKAIDSTGGAASPFLNADALIPVPLHPKREFERGYNQAKLLAEELSLLIGIAYDKTIPVDSEYLERVSDTVRMKNLSGGERAAGISGAFRVCPQTRRYRRVLIVDDIFTTGATINECAKTLRHAGTAVIYFITVTIGA